jgi:hypothetical protein
MAWARICVLWPRHETFKQVLMSMRPWLQYYSIDLYLIRGRPTNQIQYTVVPLPGAALQDTACTRSPTSYPTHYCMEVPFILFSTPRDPDRHFFVLTVTCPVFDFLFHVRHVRVFHCPSARVILFVLHFRDCVPTRSHATLSRSLCACATVSLHAHSFRPPKRFLRLRFRSP